MRSRALLTSGSVRGAALIRLAVGAVFLSEGVQKFLFPATLGAGRFAKIGIPWSSLSGPFVGAIEIGCGALVLAGVLTRVAALVLALEMVVAITSTKIPMLLGRAFLSFAAPAAGKTGFWAMAHEGRTDFAMLLGCLFLAWEGAGPWSLDAWMSRRR